MSGLPPGVVDVVVLVVLALAMAGGFRSGFIATTYSLASWFLAIAAAFALDGPAATALEALGMAKPLGATIGFVIVLFVVEALFALAGGLVLHPFIELIRRGPLAGTDRVLGVVPGAVRSLLLMAIAVVAIGALPLSSDVKAAVETSRTGRIVGDRFVELQPQITALANQLGGAPLLVTKLGEDDTQTLDVPDDLALAPDVAAERQLFELLNEERVSRGRTALVWDERLVTVARAHSTEMFRAKYFSHHSPVSGTPFDRLRAAGVTYTRAGENLAYAQSVAIAHRALMESPGHRENILRPEFTHVGIGVMSAGVYGRMVTQLFITR